MVRRRRYLISDTITTSKGGKGTMASGGETAGAGASEAGAAAPDTVQSLQHEIEVIKAKIAKEREKIRDKSLHQVADIASVPSIDQVNTYLLLIG